jgi:hypothetical protein
MTMLRKISLLALLVLTPSTSFAEDLTCPTDSNGDATMAQYAQCLRDKYGPESLVTGGALPVAITANKNYHNFLLTTYTEGSGEAKLTTVSSAPYPWPAKPLCKQPYIEKTSGSYIYRWCADSSVAPNEVKRDKILNQSGRLTNLDSTYWDCGSAVDVLAMPTEIKTLACH